MRSSPGQSSHCSVTPTSASITGKPKCGTVVELSWSIQRLSCGRLTRDCHLTRERFTGFGVLHWNPGECGSEIECQVGRTTVVVSANPSRRRSSGGMGAVVLLWSHQGEFLVAQRSTSTDFLVCPAARRPRVGLFFPTHLVLERVAGGQIDVVRTTWQRRTRFVERSSHQRSRPLGKLGGQFAHGASETLRSRKDDGRWVGTGSSQLFHSRSRVCAIFGRRGFRATGVGVPVRRCQTSVGRGGGPNAAEEDWLAGETGVTS